MALSDFRRGYLLFEAFQAIGKRLYGSQWTGLELTSVTVEDPNPREENARAIEAQLDALDEQIGAVEDRRKATLDAEEIRSLEQEIAAAVDERSHLRAVLFKTRPQPAFWESFEANKRRALVRAKLEEALAEGQIEAVAVSGLGIPRDYWRGSEPHFWHDIELSMVRVPKQFSSRRRSLLMIKEDEFDRWLATVQPLIIEENDTVTPEDICREHLRKLVFESSDGSQPAPKDEIFARVLEIAPGLSRRRFDRIWQEETPDSWQGPGRRGWQGKPRT